MVIDVEKVKYFLRMMYPTMEQYVKTGDGSLS